MICTKLQTIQNEIASVAVRCGRDPISIKLVAVSKLKTMEQISEAYNCGQTLFGENYIQEARDKIHSLDKTISWHFIGRLQSNKTKQAVELFNMIETVDRLKIAEMLNNYASHFNKYQDILLQVNIGREKQKGGILLEDISDMILKISKLEHLRLQGLMIIPPWSPDAEKNRPYFRELKKLSEHPNIKKNFINPDRVELSMGMSHDFHIAIEEGATIVRIGTAIFGPRHG